MMIDIFELIGLIMLLFLAIIGYFALGITVSIFNYPSLGEDLEYKYMGYLLKKYPEKYHKDEGGFFWVKDCDYGSHSMENDEKVKKFTTIVYTLLFIFWPIDFIYKIIKTI